MVARTRLCVTLYVHCLSCVSFDTIRRPTVTWSPQTKCLRTDVVKRLSICIFTRKSHYAELVGDFFILYNYVELKTHQCNTSHLWVYSQWTPSGSQFSFYKQTVSHVKSLRKVWAHVGEWRYTSSQSTPEERVPETRWIGDWVCLIAGGDSSAMEEIFCPCLDSNTIPSTLSA
jgi:hypothetical protein